MIFCARATRGRGMPSEDQSAPIPGEKASKQDWTDGTGVARCPSCSRNAHDRNVFAWDKSASRRARGWAGENVARSQGQPRPPP